MRDLEVRAWNKNLKRYIRFLSLEVRGIPNSASQTDSVGVSLGGLFADENLIFEFYTGVKDMNGKKIYEGDIIKFLPPEKHIATSKREVDVVYWSSNDACFFVAGEPLYKVYWNNCEVIGNLHEE